ncbi:hypothetical protein [Sporolactobacillus putidus]|uniref:hypothetical protein n=1 Tax=Sporolactobacillus putidus TaxID=492735 RepID=UPI001662DB7A|nr:hypothetical protein [Sporolactobacillus putidus]
MIDLLTYMLNDPALPSLLFILGLSVPFLHAFRFGKARAYSLHYCSESEPCSLISISVQTHVHRVDSFSIWLSHVMGRKESSGGDSEHHDFPSKILSA